MRIVIALCLTVVLMGCGDSFVSTKGGTAGGTTTTGTGGNAGQGGNGAGGTGGNTNTGGNAGEGGTAGGTTTTGTGGNTGGTGGTGGNTGGTGGQGGQGGSPCTGIYMQIASIGPNSVNSNAGTTTLVTFDIFGTGPNNKLTMTPAIVNNLVANFMSAMGTTLADYVRLRAQDPGGGSIFNEVCKMPITSGQANCPQFVIYSASSGIVQLQIQIKPKAGTSGQVRFGLKPDTVPLCNEDQSSIPLVNIF